MIINPVDKGYEQQSHRPNVCWKEGWILVDETTEEGKQLAQKIMDHYPYYELVLDNDGNLIDIVPTERPKPEIVVEEIDEEKIAMAEAIIQHEMEIQALKKELEILKGGN